MFVGSPPILPISNHLGLRTVGCTQCAILPSITPANRLHPLYHSGLGPYRGPNPVSSLGKRERTEQTLRRSKSRESWAFRTITCQHRLFGLTKTMAASNISLALPPNPCTNPLFQPPIYEFSNITVIKNFYRDSPDNDTVVDNYRGPINFTVRDVANNFSLNCSWGYFEYVRGYATTKEDWGWKNCVDPATGSALPIESRITVLLNLDQQELMGDRTRALQTPIRIAQYWYCDTVNGSYPEAYRARADVFLNTDCPAVGKKSSAVACNTTQPVKVKAQWITRGTLFPGTRQLERRPAVPAKTRGIAPPPSNDCPLFSRPRVWDAGRACATPGKFQGAPEPMLPYPCSHNSVQGAFAFYRFTMPAHYSRDSRRGPELSPLRVSTEDDFGSITEVQLRTAHKMPLDSIRNISKLRTIPGC